MSLSLVQANARLTAPGQPFEITEAEVMGRQVRVWKNAHRSLREILERSRDYGSATFVVYEKDRLSFEEHYQAVASVARALVERFGVAKGDRVAIAMRNFPEWSVAFWAAAAVGAIVVPLNSWWKGDELRYGMDDSGAVVLFADEARAQELATHLPELGLKGVIVARARAPLAEGQVPFAEIRGWPGAGLPEVAVEPEDDATLFYTSGTTGFPKGAVGTHHNICSNLMTLEFLRARAALRTGISPPADLQLASLLTVPLFHVTGCHSTLVPSLALGSKLVLVYKFDPEVALELIERERVTSFGGVPAMVWQIIEAPNFSNYDTSSVLRVGYGGAPAAPELVRRIKQAFPDANPSNGYGLTESSSVTSQNSGQDYISKPDSVGPPVPVCRVKVVDDEGRSLPTGEVGELWIQGPNVFRCYLNKPEATAETLTDGWLHSGDLARIDDEGFVYIVDRAKDVVIRGGENVYCVEVESVLFDHPAVMEAAVFAKPHRILGEEVAAAVRIKPGVEVSEEELKARAAAKLAAFKVPVQIHIQREDFPRNPNGKILKRQLREAILGP